MKAGDIRADLFKKIEHMNAGQLKEFYGLLQNYFNSNSSIEEWDQLSELQRKKLELGIAAADAGKVKPASEIISRLRKKYQANV